MKLGMKSHSALARFEVLESRRLLSGSISGSVISDPDADGVGSFDDQRLELANRRVWLDLNGNSALDAGEPIARTNTFGNYHFLNLSPGVYQIRVLLGTSEVQTSPPKKHAVLVNVVDGADAKASRLLIAPPPTQSIAGTVFYDSNGDGAVSKTAPTLAGRTVFLDNNQNSRYDAGERHVKSDAQGHFNFTGLYTGTYFLGINIATGWRNSQSVKTLQAVILPRGDALVRRPTGILDSPPRFLLTRTAIITAEVYTLQGFTPQAVDADAFLDTNNNGTMDGNEVRVPWANGISQMVVGPGTYHIRVILPDRHTKAQDVTITAGQEVDLMFSA